MRGPSVTTMIEHGMVLQSWAYRYRAALIGGLFVHQKLVGHASQAAFWAMINLIGAALLHFRSRGGSWMYMLQLIQSIFGEDDFRQIRVYFLCLLIMG
jgi:hypothetical protein